MKKMNFIVLIIAVLMFVSFQTQLDARFQQSSASIVINEFDPNAPGDDRLKTTMERVELFNRTNFGIDVSGWRVSSTGGSDQGSVRVENGTVIAARGFLIVERANWLDNSNESVVLRDDEGNFVDETPVVDDESNDKSWQRCPDGNDTNAENDWVFKNATFKNSNGNVAGAPNDCD
jgi:hypothetical protein